MHRPHPVPRAFVFPFHRDLFLFFVILFLQFQNNVYSYIELYRSTRFDSRNDEKHHNFITFFFTF